MVILQDDINAGIRCFFTDRLGTCFDGYTDGTTIGIDKVTVPYISVIYF